MWICRFCETENQDDVSSCVCCGHEKQENDTGREQDEVIQTQNQNTSQNSSKKKHKLLLIPIAIITIIVVFFLFMFGNPQHAQSLRYARSVERFALRRQVINGQMPHVQNLKGVQYVEKPVTQHSDTIGKNARMKRQKHVHGVDFKKVWLKGIMAQQMVIILMNGHLCRHSQIG